MKAVTCEIMKYMSNRFKWNHIELNSITFDRFFLPLSMISGCRYQVFDFLYHPDLHIKTCWPNTTHQICRQQYHKERQHVPLDNGNNIHKFPLDNGNNIHTFHKHLPEFVHTALIELLTTIVLNLKWHI